ncbi:MAG: hypothetical protein ABSC37_06400 [Xanthobacteraceae bacterium]
MRTPILLGQFPMDVVYSAVGAAVHCIRRDRLTHPLAAAEKARLAPELARAPIGRAQLAMPLWAALTFHAWKARWLA